MSKKLLALIEAYKEISNRIDKMGNNLISLGCTMSDKKPPMIPLSENLVHALAGAGGGMISMAMTYPLITVGTRIQVQKGANGSSDSKEYRGFMDAVEKIVKKEGFVGLYSGLGSALFGIALTNGVYYYWYEAVRVWMEQMAVAKRSSRTLSPLEGLVAGAVAGVATVLITNPVWVINTRLATGNKRLEEDDSPGNTPPGSRKSSASSLQQQQQAQLRSFRNGNASAADTSISESSTAVSDKKAKENAIQLLFSILREEGVGSLWQGVMPALILVANPSIQYMVFEQLKLKLVARRGSAGVHSFDFFLLGAMSKLVATFVTYPYIVIKSRMQLRRKKGNRRTSAYQSTFTAFQAILKTEGLAGLYRGLNSKLLQSVLTAAFLFWAKEALVGWTRLLVEMVALKLQMRFVTKQHVE